MTTLTYSTRFDCSPQDQAKLFEVLESEQLAYNECSKLLFEHKLYNLKHLHKAFYKNFREKYPHIKAQIVIKAENSCLAAYRSARSNKHKLTEPIVKKKLAIWLDKRLQTVKPPFIHITTLDKRVCVKPVLYDKLQQRLDQYNFGDLLLFERDGKLYISFFFKVPDVEVKPKLALGIDLGIRRLASTSDGVLYIDKPFNCKKRKLRYLKRKLQAKGTRSAKRHLKKLRRKERNLNKELYHQLTSKLLKTKANVLVLEDLDCVKLKKKKHAHQNKSRISQVGFGEIRRILTYKAGLVNKQVVCVNPAYSSQTDCISGKREGERRGCRFYSKSGLVYDADINAAVNLTRFAELPASLGTLLSGQGIVTCPIVGVRPDKPRNSFRG